MERYTDSLAILVTQGNLDINLTLLHVLSEYPHLSSFVQNINNRSLDIILWQEAFDNQLSLQRGDTQFQQSLTVLQPIIPEKNPKNLCLDIELFQKYPYFVYRHHISLVLSKRRYKQLSKIWRFLNDKVEYYRIIIYFTLKKYTARPSPQTTFHPRYLFSSTFQSTIFHSSARCAGRRFW